MPVHDGVYRMAEVHLSARRQLLAACLAVGGMVGASHRAALWLWDLRSATPPVELTASATHRAVPSGAIVHVRAELAGSDLTVHRGVPVTTVVRTLVDAGSVVDRATLATAVDKAIYLGLVTPEELAERCNQAVTQYQPGLATLREVFIRRAARSGAGPTFPQLRELARV